jgi:membrane-bound metal-dependent hydrolase YbcI (DUF457 family)
MPLALGHLAVGLLTTGAIEKPKTTTRKKVLILFLLANSPDVDIAISWLLTGSFYSHHRTFTHGVLFAVVMGALFANLYRYLPSFPKLSYKWCYWAVFSHVLADYLFSPWKVDFLWPLPFYPASLNGALDFVAWYASVAREAQVLFFCLFVYLFVKTLNAAAIYLYRLLQPA